MGPDRTPDTLLFVNEDGQSSPLSSRSSQKSQVQRHAQRWSSRKSREEWRKALYLSSSDARRIPLSTRTSAFPVTEIASSTSGRTLEVSSQPKSAPSDATTTSSSSPDHLAEESELGEFDPEGFSVTSVFRLLHPSNI